MVKMKPGDSLKTHVSYFQSQMSSVYNCNEDVVATTFIFELQVTRLFYNHMVEKDVTNIGDILARAQKYMQIEEVTHAITSHPPKQGSKVEKLKPQFPPRKNLSHNFATV